MRRVSLRILAVGLIICLCAGIGIGYAIKSKQTQAQNSEITQQKEEIASLIAGAEQLQAQIAALTSEVEEKQAAYDSLNGEYDSASKDLRSLQESYNKLEEDYQILQKDYDELQNALDNSTISEFLSLKQEISSLKSENNLLNVQIAQLTKLITPSPDHALVRKDVWGNPKFRSVRWEGQDYELQLKVEEIAQLYHRTHIYIEGETDCNDMAVDIWDMLLKEGIKSVIVVGNKDKTGETFTDCIHAWLYVFNAEGQVIYLEPTTGEVMYGQLPDGTTNPKVIPYREGFMYEKPSDLRKDLKSLW